MLTRFMIVQDSPSMKNQIVTIVDGMSMDDVLYTIFEMGGCVGVKDLETDEWVMTKHTYPEKTFLQDIVAELNRIKDEIDYLIMILKMKFFGG